ncbi:LysR family transcriptional regulator [Pseudonocardia sp. HH130629-09]|uniref:LysR family transcriptional regulator n=1 Tax=Pseudonocardia sp. HH130629-09 TaxID=1641402 RepID=UPI0009E7D24A|nr:LysR family transcriptional regulator [Pseudonocardia sp. HH130629-09]
MDFQALRTFVAVAETGQFQAAADDLRISQQAVSKRVAALEKHLGVTLLVRSSRGSRASLDGQAFLPHAKKILAAVEQAQQAVHPQRRPLRVDVLNRRIAPAQAVYAFYRANPGTALDTVTLAAQGALDAVRTVLDGSVDVSFRAIRADQIPPGVRAERLLDNPLQALLGPAHPLAGADQLRPEDLAGHRVWIPGMRFPRDRGGFLCRVSGEGGVLVVDR